MEKAILCSAIVVLGYVMNISIDQLGTPDSIIPYLRDWSLIGTGIMLLCTAS